MPATDDEYRATAVRAMMALEADLHHALHDRPSREVAREIARDMRGILTRSLAALGVDGAEDLTAIYDRSSREALNVFGTAGWDDTDGPDLPPQRR
jgi:hypothetical protein